jgi:hypothetical protein
VARGVERMRPSLETAVHWYDLAGWILVAALMVGAVCTIVIVFMGIVKEGYWDQAREAAKVQIAQLESETAKAKAEVEKAHLAIAETVKQTELARADAAEANKKAETERLERLKLEAIVAPPARVLRPRPDLWRTAFATDPDFIFALLQ